MSSSVGHTLALTSAGDVLSWGNNTQGQLGDGTQTSSTSPVVVDLSAHLGDSSVTSVVAGTNHSLALTDDGRIFGWGSSSNRQLGTGDTTRALLPVPADTSLIPDGRMVLAPLTVAFGSPDHVGTNVFYDRATHEVRALTPARAPGAVEVTVTRSAAPAVCVVAGHFTFGAPPVVTTQPSIQVVESGTAVRLKVAAEGDTAPDVLWQTSLDGRTWETVTDGVLTESHPTTVVGGAVVPGTTTSTVDLTATAPRLSVRAVLDNGMGEPVESDVALVELSDPPVVIDSHRDGGASDAVPLVHGRGAPGSAITVAVDGARASEAVVGDHGHWLVRVPEPMALGTRTIAVTQDTDGSHADATVSVVGHAAVGWGPTTSGRQTHLPGRQTPGSST